MSKQIDWEQRRWDAVVAAMKEGITKVILEHEDAPKGLAKCSIQFVDALIAEYRRTEDNQGCQK